MKFRFPAVRTLVAFSLLTLTLAPLGGCKGGVRALIAKFRARRSHSKPNTTDYADNVQQAVSQARLNVLKNPDFSQYQQQVQKFYDDRNFELAWTRDGKPTASATALIAMFQDAEKKGLKPEDYDGSLWSGREDKLSHILATHDSSDDAQTTVAQFDAAMTIATMRFASDLHEGRVNPQALNFDIDVPAKRAAFDLPTFVNEQAVDADDVTSVIAGIEPQNPMYKSTEEALAKYLDLAKQENASPHEDLPDVAKPVTVGGSYPALAQLKQRLQVEGDLSSDTAATSYDQTLSDAVKQWQLRHGLTADGKLTQATVDSLNVPLAARVQQLNLALERWRWLPDQYVQPRVLVNLPEYIVRTYDADHNLAFKMKVVDGESDGHDTPIFVRTMKYLIFRPYWNLPVSIVKKELMKHVSSGGAGYLERNNYEVVNSSGQPVSGWTADGLEHSRYMVRQKPGPKNSLGLVKFMLPNEYDIYLHSTPEMNLFNLTKRDRSHGCIRLNDAEKMADWVLEGQGDWGRGQDPRSHVRPHRRRQAERQQAGQPEDAASGCHHLLDRDRGRRRHRPFLQRHLRLRQAATGRAGQGHSLRAGYGKDQSEAGGRGDGVGDFPQ